MRSRRRGCCLTKTDRGSSAAFLQRLGNGGVAIAVPGACPRRHVSPDRRHHPTHPDRRGLTASLAHARRRDHRCPRFAAHTSDPRPLRGIVNRQHDDEPSRRRRRVRPRTAPNAAICAFLALRFDAFVDDPPRHRRDGRQATGRRVAGAGGDRLPLSRPAAGAPPCGRSRWAGTARRPTSPDGTGAGSGCRRCRLRWSARRRRA